MKWDATEPSRNNVNFGSADRIANHARSQNKQLRGHILVWHSQLPAWMSGIRDANTLRSEMNNHINVVASRYRGQIHSFGRGSLAVAAATALLYIKQRR